MIDVEKAVEIILENLPGPRVEAFELMEAHGHILAQEIVAHLDNPPFDSSAMDGYAIISSDTAKASRENPTILKIVDEISAGLIPQGKIGSGEAAKIMTGALLPDGADAVVMAEYTSEREGEVEVYKEVGKGENVRKKGEDFLKGETLLCSGTKIGASEIGILASLGYKMVRIYPPPRIAIIATGEELVEPGDSLSPGKIYNCNNYSLSAQVLEAGAIPFNLGIVRDERRDLMERIREAINNYDMIITSGGVSIGEYDFVKDVLIEMGLKPLFWKVAIKPGKPTIFGLLEGRPYFGLPGYPVSSMVSFELFVRPAILKLLGEKEIFRPRVKVRVVNEIRKKPGRVNYLRVSIQYDPTHNGYKATLTGPQGSGILSSMLKANGLLIVPKEVSFVKPGTELDAILIKD